MSSPGHEPLSVAERDRILAAADGYAELGLPDLAREELAALPPEDLARPEVRELFLGLLIREKRWDEAISSGRLMCLEGSQRPAVYIHTAFALHEAGRTAEAMETLTLGPESLRTDPLYHYNMACYLAVGGELRDAEVFLRTAFRMDGKLRNHARRDPDLKNFRGQL